MDGDCSYLTEDDENKMDRFFLMAIVIVRRMMAPVKATKGTTVTKIPTANRVIRLFFSIEILMLFL